MKNILEKNRIWRLADQGDFMAIIESLSVEGVAEKNLGEVLFSLSDQAVDDTKYHTAISILMFILQSLEDSAEAPPLIKKIGNLYALLSDHEKAREYYGKLPVTLENIKLCFETFLPSLDIEGLLILRDTILTKVTDNANQKIIHSFVNEIISKIYNVPEIFNTHTDLFEKNLTCLKKTYPFSQNFNKYSPYFSVDSSKYLETDILRHFDNIYLKGDNGWIKLFSPEQIKNLSTETVKNDTNRIAYCDSPESFFLIINRLKTSDPAHIKHECWIITDFNLLWTMMPVLDLSVLNNCNFVIRFIDKHNLKSQLTHLLLEKKQVTDKVVYLSQDDPDFFSKHVLPITKECQTKMEQQIELYQTQLLQIFKGDYQKKVFEKIKSGQPLRILLLTSKFTTYLQYSTRDMAKGFRQLGHETFIEIEDEDSGLGIRKDVNMENLINFRPDIIFSIDHLRHSNPWIPKSIPFVSWIQDLMPHLIGLTDPELVSRYDHIFSFSQHWIDHFFKKHPVFKNKKIHLLPITSDHKIYHPLPLSKKRYDVSYVAHLPDPDHTLLPFLGGNTPPDINPEKGPAFLTQLALDLDEISMEHLFSIQNDRGTKEKLATQICEKLNIPFDQAYLQLMENHDQNNAKSRFLFHIFYLLKTKPIKTLIENNIQVRVFGNHWEKIPLFENIAMGKVENGTELNKVFNESRINLNISPETTYHMKAPEVMAGNNFMLTRLIPKAYDIMPIDIYFNVDNEIALFKNEKELLEKVRVFLTNPDKRNQIATAAYEKFLSTLTIDKSAQRILDALSSEGEINSCPS